MDYMELIKLLAPLIFIQFILVIVALVDLFKRPHTKGPKWAWVPIIVFINLFGPIIYFLFGRGASK
ncbi:PLD nuclease N-terminal domain-containing protein [Bacillus sp. JCM 19041]|uniref:PLD nuclease N-terminal domain-containing protein n=1 Tax=Bacillus sp. JCM 19041 TaxID=1460637 RepID=UPI0006D1D1A0